VPLRNYSLTHFTFLFRLGSLLFIYILLYFFLCCPCSLLCKRDHRPGDLSDNERVIIKFCRSYLNNPNDDDDNDNNDNNDNNHYLCCSLLEDGVCCEKNIPSISSINRIIRDKSLTRRRGYDIFINSNGQEEVSNCSPMSSRLQLSVLSISSKAAFIILCQLVKHANLYGSIRYSRLYKLFLELEGSRPFHIGFIRVEAQQFVLGAPRLGGLKD